VTTAIEDIVDLLEYYEINRGNSLSIDRKPWLASERVQLHKLVRDYNEGESRLETPGPSGKFGKTHNDLRKLQRKLREAIAMMVHQHNDLAFGVVLDDGKVLRVTRHLQNLKTIGLVIVNAPALAGAKV
jgi:hypothetical protein